MIITPLIFMKNIRNVSTGARESMRMWVLSKLIMKILIARAFKRKNGKALNRPIDKYNHAIDAIRYAVATKLTEHSNTTVDVW